MKDPLDSQSLSGSSRSLLPDFHAVRKSTLIFRALNHPLRQKMLSILQENKQITVTELFQMMKLEQSVVSQHLAILRRSGFVQTKREGKFIWYTLNPERLRTINECLKLLLYS
jgi:DNA-binding transcriptional ArsR family regulator